MTILFIYNNLLNPEIGGTERATHLVMNELAKRGYHTIGLLHADRESPSNFHYNGISIRSLSDFLKENKVDVVVNQIAFHNWLLESFLKNGGAEWRKNGGKIISFMHLDPTPPPRNKFKAYFEDWNKRTFKKKIKRLGFVIYSPIFHKRIKRQYRSHLKYLYENSDKYIVMSESYINIFLKQARVTDSAKLSVIQNMLTFPQIEEPSILDNKEKKVIVVARLDDEQKNISFILDVWKSLADHHGYTLHIVGSGKDQDKLIKYASEIPDVKFEGQKSPYSWYTKSRIFLGASPREGWGLTITESLQCGVVPIVLNTSKVFSDIIYNGENGLIVNSKKEYIKALEKLMTDDCFRENLAKHGLSSANRFTSESIGDKWEHLLKELYQPK